MTVIRTLIWLAPLLSACAAGTEAPSSHVAASRSASGHADHGIRDDAPAVHGMVLLGEETLFVSHLPMFHRPHDFQVILEVALTPTSPAAPSPLDILAEDRFTHDADLYTVVPDVFRLPLVDLFPDAPFAFDGAIVRGHFERGGETIIERARFTVVRKLHFEQLLPTAPRPADPSYLLFGNGDALFVAHVITTRPDFDQLVAVTIAGEHPAALADVVKAGGAALVTFPEVAPDTALSEGQIVEGVLPDGSAISLLMVREHYLEHGDLSF